jgi:hypothetical protein
MSDRTSLDEAERFKRSTGADEPDGKPDKASESTIVATPFAWRDPATFPRRQWLYRGHLIRKFVSATVGPGGSGKSKLSITDALAMITARNLTGRTVGNEPLRVWMWNLEDPREELERRILAACQHFEIAEADIGGRLFLDSGREQPCCLAKHSFAEGAFIVVPVRDAIIAAIAKRQMDVVMIDPWISSHRVPENNNEGVDLVVKEWAHIADQCNCAIELYAHTRKLGGQDVTTESARGGKSLTDATRSVRVINRMTGDEGLKAKVDNHRLYFRIYSDKLNLAPPADVSDWYGIRNVLLANGDEVGVVAPWKWPSALDDVTVKHLLEVQKLMAGGRWREDIRAKDWAGKAVAKVLDLNLDEPSHREKAKGCLDIWIKNGVLKIELGKDAKAEERKFIVVGEWADA